MQVLSAESGGCVEVLNVCMEKVIGCIRANRLKFTADKTEILLVSDKTTA